MAQAAVVRHELVGGIFGGDPALDRETVLHDLRLGPHADFRIGQRLPLGDEDLRLDQIVASDLFGDGVLDLNTGIDFDEVTLAGIDVQKKLDGARIIQPGGAADGESGVPHGLAKALVQIRRRRELDDLLMPSLQRAVALEEMDEIAVPIADQLHFDMASPPDEFLEENIAHAERGPGFALGLFNRFIELFGFEGYAHAAPAAPHRRLDDDRIAQAFR